MNPVTVLSDPAVPLVTRALLSARRSGQPCRSADPALRLASDAAAWAVQEAVCAALAGPPGSRPAVWKAGAAARGAACSGSPLPASGVRHGPTRLCAADFRRHGIEAEIAFRLARPVRTLPHEADALGCFDAMCVAIEVVDSRWAEAMDAPERLRLADLQSHGALVLGDWRPLRAVDWATQACRIDVNGQPAARSVASHACVDPGSVLHGWLAHVLARVGTLEAGDVVTTGSWGGALWVAPGDAVAVEFPGLGVLALDFRTDRDRAQR